MVKDEGRWLIIDLSTRSQATDAAFSDMALWSAPGHGDSFASGGSDSASEAARLERERNAKIAQHEREREEEERAERAEAQERERRFRSHGYYYRRP